MRLVAIDGTYDAWQRAARRLLAEQRAPHTVTWVDETHPERLLDGLDDDEPVNAPPNAAVTVPKAFVHSARRAALHRDPQRWTVLYRLLWQVTHGHRRVLDDDTDADVRRLRRFEAQVGRDIHKMHAFVRFREVVDGDDRRYVAWHRPDHLIVAAVAPFFVERFRVMRWSILTPDACAHWDGHRLTLTPGASAADAPSHDALETLWRTYYASMFNPARVNRRAMVKEMPVRHWATLPEASLIPGLLASAEARVAAMVAHPGRTTSARPFIPPDADVRELAAAAATCAGCELHRAATQVVFGEGPAQARLLVVGEQPGDEEDQRGRPFVGPAGQVLDDALAAAGVARDALYVTNVVKHFSFRREGTRRLHERPRAAESRACRPWLEREMALVRPAAIVCLGSVAMEALLGPGRRVSDARGRRHDSPWAPHLVVTYHPSAVLRASSATESRDIRAALVDDLRLAATLSRDPATAPRTPDA
ncbi:UdgX family uracil-DNA binding protein [Luteitalea sp.]